MKTPMFPAYQRVNSLKEDSGNKILNNNTNNNNNNNDNNDNNKSTNNCTKTTNCSPAPDILIWVWTWALTGRLPSRYPP